MSVSLNLESLFFYYGFRKCSKNSYINFTKIEENQFLVFRISRDTIADLFYEKYKSNETPCSSKPIDYKTIKLDFEKEKDRHLLEKYF